MTGISPIVSEARNHGSPAITRGNDIYTLEDRFERYSKPGPTFFSEIVHTAQYRAGDLSAIQYAMAAAFAGGHDNHLEAFAHSLGAAMSEKWNRAGGYDQCRKR
jgi:hypothetical protein